MTGGIFDLKGNVTMTSFGLGVSTATTVFRISGTGSQTLAGSAGTLPNLEINKPSGTLNMTGTTVINGTLNYVAGTTNATGSTVRFISSIGTRTSSPNGISLGHVEFQYQNSSSTISLNNQTLNVTGDVTFNSSLPNSALNSGTISVSGNAIKSGTNSIAGTVGVNFVGSSDSTITPSGTTAFPGSTTINKTGGAKVSLAGDSYFNNTGQNLTIAAGTLDMAGFNLTVGNNISNSGVLRRGTNPSCGSITQGGSYSGSAAICP